MGELMRNTITDELVERIEESIGGESAFSKDNDDEFEQLAFSLFQQQYELNGPYRKFCDSKGRRPSSASNWLEIPAVPAAAFKMAELASFQDPTSAAKILFETSGTSNSMRKGRVFRDDTGVRVFEAASLGVFDHFALCGLKEMRIVALSPPPEAFPNSAIAYIIGLWVDARGSSGSLFTLGVGGLDVDKLIGALREAEAEATPVLLVGATFGFVRFCDQCVEKGISFQLAAGSRLVDGGGYKGRSRELQKDEFIKLVSGVFGLPEPSCVNLLGATEFATQFFDCTLRNAVDGVSEPRYKRNTGWTRSIAMSTDNPDCRLTCDIPIPGWDNCFKSEVGLLRHYDLGNTSSVMAIQTEDLGYEVRTPHGTGFEILGRASGAEARGCSISIDELIDRGAREAD